MKLINWLQHLVTFRGQYLPIVYTDNSKSILGYNQVGTNVYLIDSI